MSSRKPVSLRPAREVIDDILKMFNLTEEAFAQKTSLTADTVRRFHYGPYSGYTSYPTLQKALSNNFDLPANFFNSDYTPKAAAKVEEKPAVKEAPKAEVKAEAKPEIKEAPKAEPKAEVKPEVKKAPKAEPKAEEVPAAEVKEVEVKAEAAPVVEVAPVAEAVPEVKAAPAAEAVPAAQAAPAIPVAPTIVLSPEYRAAISEAIATEVRLQVISGGNRRVEELAKIASLIGEDKVDLLIQIAKSYLK